MEDGFWQLILDVVFDLNLWQKLFQVLNIFLLSFAELFAERITYFFTQCVCVNVLS